MSIRIDVPAALDVAEVEQRRLAEERPGECQGKQGQGRGPEQEQQDVVEPAPARQPRGRRAQEHQGAERDLPLRRPADQVEHDRGGDRQGPEDVERREEAHRVPPRPGAIGPSAGPASPAHPGLEQVEEDQLQRPVGRDRLELDPKVGAGPLDLRRVFLEPAEVLAPGRVGVDVELAARFDVAEHRRAGEPEVDLGRVEHPEDDHVVAPRPQVAEPGPERVDRGEQVGDQDDQATLADGRGDLFEGLGQVGRLAQRLAFEHPHQAAELAGPVARGEIVGDLVFEGHQADGVALAGEEVGDRGRGGPGVVPLAVGAASE